MLYTDSMALSPAVQIRFNKIQLDYLAKVREVQGTPVGEQIRRMVEREMNIAASLPYTPLPGEHVEPPLPVINHQHYPPPLDKQQLTKPRVRRK